MGEIRRLPIDKILLGERRRPVDRHYAAVIGASMRAHGQLQPILVRPTPAARRAYTLVAGGHRLVGAEIEGLAEIDVIIVKADGGEALLMELAENLHRNDLSVLDRAQFVAAYRTSFEERYGPVTRGGDQSAKLALWSVDGNCGFSSAVADRLGLSKRSAQRLGEIARKLQPDLRLALQGLPVADNQSLLLKLTRLSPSLQRQMVTALSHEPDPVKALALVVPPSTPGARVLDQSALFSQLVTAWAGADVHTQARFLAHIRSDEVRRGGERRGETHDAVLISGEEEVAA